MNLFRTSLFLAALFTGGSLARAQTDETPITEAPPAHIFHVGTGFDYSRGKYGFAQATEVFSIPLQLTYERPHWIFRANLPYLTLRGPAEVVGTGTAINPATTNPARPNDASEAGLGDLLLSGTRLFGPILGPVNLDVTARVKLPTADETKGLGTGETDFYVQADFYRIYTRIIPFATLGYRMLSDSDRYALESGPFASAGAAYRFTERTRGGFAADWRARLVRDGEDAYEASVFATHTLNEDWMFIVYALTGFTEASPDLGLGGSATFRF